MNYKENERDWKVEDIIIHDADAKTPRMLMRVIGFNEKLGLIRTVYLDRNVNGAIFENEKKYLHDPKKFGIEVVIEQGIAKVASFNPRRPEYVDDDFADFADSWGF